MIYALNPSVVLTGKPYLNFINSLKSKHTKKEYRKRLINFLSYNQASIESVLTLPVKDIEQLITQYLTNLNTKSLSYGYINQVMSAIFHFFEMNDIVLNKRKISKFLGERKKANKDRAYSHEEIKLLADTGDFRFRAFIFLLASTGIRIGAIPSLLIRHCQKLENENEDIYKITIYENTREEYFVFTTPEATRALDSYLEYRRRASEVITPDSPLFRNDFDMSSMHRTRKNSRSRALGTLRNVLYQRLLKVGLFDKSELDNNNNNSYDFRRNRHITPMTHGFRKFWMTQAVNAKMNPEIREMLLGHKIGIAGAYYRPSEEEMLTEFSKAIDVLTIDPSQRLQRKVEKLEVEKNSFEQLRAKIESLEARMSDDKKRP
jgi:integrase